MGKIGHIDSSSLKTSDIIINKSNSLVIATLNFNLMVIEADAPVTE
jgi:hypothetical protein